MSCKPTSGGSVYLRRVSRAISGGGLEIDMSSETERLSYIWSVAGFVFFLFNLSWTFVLIAPPDGFMSISYSIVMFLFSVTGIAALLGFSLGLIFIWGEGSYYSTHHANHCFRGYGSMSVASTGDPGGLV